MLIRFGGAGEYLDAPFSRYVSVIECLLRMLLFMALCTLTTEKISQCYYATFLAELFTTGCIHLFHTLVRLAPWKRLALLAHTHDHPCHIREILCPIYGPDRLVPYVNPSKR